MKEMDASDYLSLCLLGGGLGLILAGAIVPGLVFVVIDLLLGVFLR